MLPNSPLPPSRRAILGAAIGAAVAAVASAFGRPAAVVAADGDPLICGQSNSASAMTSLTMSGQSQYAAFGISSSSTERALYVVGGSEAAVEASGTNVGVRGSGTIIGVQGGSQTGTGVRGTSEAANYGAVEGRGPIGVAGWGGTTPGLLSTMAGTGVYGTGTATGIRGEAAGGTGVHGSGSVVGVRGDTTSGTGVKATATTGVALDVVGRARFSRARRVTIAAGRSSLKVTLAGVTTSSLVFAVLRSQRSGVWVRAVVPASGYFTIYLNKAPLSSTYVVYFVVN